MYYGDIRLGDTIDIKFTTRRFTTGAPFTLAGSPVISAYVGNGTTEITAGITLSVDFDGRTGLNNVRVVATSGNGFATATNVQLVITTGTVDSVSVVGEVIGEFSIEARSALMPTTAARTLDVSAGGEAGVDWANVGSPTTALNLSGTTVKTATDVETDTADIQTRIGTPSNLGGGATLSANLSDIEGQTDDIGVAGAGLTAVPWNAAWDAEVQSEVDDALVAHRLDELLNADSDIDGAAPPTVGSVFHELMTKTAGSFTYDQTTDSNEAIRDRGDAAWITATGFSTHSAADVWAVATRTLTAFDASFKTGYALSAAGIQAIWDALTSALTTVGSIGKLLVDNINATISSRLASASYTTPPTVGQIADQVWDETLADHLTAGSTGNALNAAGSAGDPWSTALPGAYGAGTAGKIIGDNVNATISSRASQASLDTVDNLVDDLESRLGTPSNLGSGATVAANLVDIEGQTDDIGTAGAGLTALGDTRIANLDATVSSRFPTASAPSNFSALGINVSGHVSRVTLVDTTTTNTDMRGTDNAALAATALSTAQWTNTRAGYLDNLNVLKIKKNTALANFPFLMVLSSDHITPATGKTITATRSIDGAAFAACANAVVEVANGIYKINLAAADLNGDTIVLKFTETDCDQRTITIATQP